MVTLTKTYKRSKEEENYLVPLIPAQGAVVLDTCFRKEVYYGQGEVSEEICKHLFRLVSGLDSAFIGETAIVSQVKKAYLHAAERYNLDKTIHKLFQTSFRVSSKVRRSTHISQGAVSYGQATTALLTQTLGQKIKDANIAVIGAHRLNETILKYLSSKGAKTFFIANRTYHKAQNLANTFNSEAFRFNDLPDILKKTDVVISATSAPHYVIRKEHIPNNKPLILIDIAVPEDIDPEVKQFKHVTMYNISDIENFIQQNLAHRMNSIEQAELIINQEVKRFLNDLCRHKNILSFRTKNNSYEGKGI